MCLYFTIDEFPENKKNDAMLWELLRGIVENGGYRIVWRGRSGRGAQPAEERRLLMSETSNSFPPVDLPEEGESPWDNPLSEGQRNALITEIVQREWDMFVIVNAGVAPKAACQRAPDTFALMRQSQAEAWTDKLLLSWRDDLMAAQSSGRNLMWEKYAHMMRFTDPVKFERVVQFLPEIDEQTQKFIDEIVEISVSWKLETQGKYPKVTDRGRPISTAEDGFGQTSFETYLRGELSTYSPKTVALYHEMVIADRDEGINLGEVVTENLARKYDYDSLEQAEENL